MLIKKIFSNIWFWIVAVFGVLIGLLKIEKYKKNKLETELNNLKKKQKEEKYEFEIKEFQAINNERVKNADESTDSINIKPNSDIRL